MHDEWLNNWGAFLAGVGAVLAPIGAWLLNRWNQHRQAKQQYDDAINRQTEQKNAMEKYFTEAIQKDNQQQRQAVEQLNRKLAQLQDEADEVQDRTDKMKSKYEEQLKLKDKEIASLKRRLANAEAMLRKHHIKLEEN